MQLIGQNLDRRLPHDLERPSGSLLSWNRPQRDSEDRDYWLGDGTKGMNYTLRLNVTGPFSLCSPDSALTLTHQSQLIFTSDGWPYPLRSVAETDGFDPAEPGCIWANATSSTHRVVDIPSSADHDNFRSHWRKSSLGKRQLCGAVRSVCVRWGQCGFFVEPNGICRSSKHCPRAGIATVGSLSI
jgi:hypothetical protein